MTSSFLGCCEIGLVVPFSGNRYKKICRVGDGYHGQVYKTIDKADDNKIVALKVIDLQKANYERAIQEVRNHHKLNHPNVIKLRGVYVRSNRYVYLVMDFAELGNMEEFLVNKRGGILNENMARYFFKQIIEGVKYCHEQGIVSRDIKLTNILVQTNRETEELLPTIKLCDFGFSCDCNKSKTKSCVGTPEYAAPEIIHAEGDEPYDGFKVDAWSCGVVLFNLVTGHQPFSGTKLGDSYKMTKGDSFIDRILNVDYTFPPNVNLTDDCINLLQGCFVADPAKRMSIGEILRHPWITHQQ
eukprot:g7756.t1